MTVVRTIADLIETAGAGRWLVLVGIGGHGAAGKSTLIDQLLAGRSASYEPWDWAAGAPSGTTVTVEPNGVVVVEGVCALHEMFRDDLGVRVWVDAPDDVRLDRAVARDGESSRTTWTEVWMPNEDAYVARDRPVECADVVVDGARPFG